jgi:hypothetical protein
MKFLGNSEIGVFYLGLDRKQARFDSGTGREIRQTAGTRFSGDAGAVDHNTEFVFQFGDFRAENIRVWMIASDTGYTFRQTRFTPRVGLRANIGWEKLRSRYPESDWRFKQTMIEEAS